MKRTYHSIFESVVSRTLHVIAVIAGPSGAEAVRATSREHGGGKGGGGKRGKIGRQQENGRSGLEVLAEKP